MVPRVDRSAKAASSSAPTRTTSLPVAAPGLITSSSGSRRIRRLRRDRLHGLPDDPDRVLPELPIKLPVSLCHRLPHQRDVTTLRGEAQAGSSSILLAELPDDGEDLVDFLFHPVEPSAVVYEDGLEWLGVPLLRGDGIRYGRFEHSCHDLLDVIAG